MRRRYRGTRSPSGARGLTWAAVAWMAAGFAVCPAQGQPAWAAMAYLDGRGDLEQEARARATLATPPGLPVTVRLVHPEQQASAADLADLVRHGARMAGERGLLLNIRGHGLPPNVGEGPAEGQARFLCNPTDRGLTARQIAGALERGLAGTGHTRVAVLVLEACFGASLEVLSELADTVDVVIAVPGESVCPGLPWGAVLRGLASVDPSPTRRSEEVARHLLDAIGASTARSPELEWSATACDLSKMRPVITALAAVSAAGSKDIAAAARGLQWARQRAVQGEALRQMSDAGQLAEGLAGAGGGAELTEAAGRLATALQQLVVARQCFGGQSAEDWAGRAGVTVFLPPALSRSVRGYASSQGLVTESGYGRLLQACLDYWAGLMPGLVGPAVEKST
jgi:hypothetical protein